MRPIKSTRSADMRVGVDLDGVGYDFCADSAVVIAAALGCDPVDLAPVTTWDFPTVWGLTMDEFWRLIYKAVAEGKVWRHGQPMPGFVEALAELRDMGHTIHVGTSRGGAEVVTLEWLLDYNVPYDSVTITKDKTVLNVDVFIEDYEGNWRALTAAGTECVLYDQPWNQHVTEAVRVYSHEEFVAYVDFLDAARSTL